MPELLHSPRSLVEGGDPLAWCSERGPTYFAEILKLRQEDTIRSRARGNNDGARRNQLVDVDALRLPREVEYVRDAIFALRGIPSRSFFLRSSSRDGTRNIRRTTSCGVVRRLCLSCKVGSFGGEQRDCGGEVPD